MRTVVSQAKNQKIKEESDSSTINPKVSRLVVDGNSLSPGSLEHLT